MDPGDVLSKAGTRTHGGRFAAVGTRAVYLSATDLGASKEVIGRKARLGGVAQISTDKYPRVVDAVAVSLKRTLELSALGSSEAAITIRRPVSLSMIWPLRWILPERRGRGRQSCRLSRQLQPQDAGP
jgi:RES domain-containing protein